MGNSILNLTKLLAFKNENAHRKAHSDKLRASIGTGRHITRNPSGNVLNKNILNAILCK